MPARALHEPRIVYFTSCFSFGARMFLKTCKKQASFVCSLASELNGPSVGDGGDTLLCKTDFPKRKLKSEPPVATYQCVVLNSGCHFEIAALKVGSKTVVPRRFVKRMDFGKLFFPTRIPNVVGVSTEIV